MFSKLQPKFLDTFVCIKSGQITKLMQTEMSEFLFKRNIYKTVRYTNKKKKSNDSAIYIICIESFVLRIYIFIFIHI